MPFYVQRGDLPAKRHVAFRGPGGDLRHEHLMGNLGFTGLQSLLYTLRPPTAVKHTEPAWAQPWLEEENPGLRMRHLRTHRLESPGGSPVKDRVPLLFNDDVALSLARPTGTDDFFYRNGRADEIIYITRGGGVLESQFGNLEYRQGDYLVIPRGIIHRLAPGSGQQIHLVIESRGYVRTPRRYRSAHGQLLEHSPFCERDIRPPSELVTRDEVGDFQVITRLGEACHRLVLAHHPFDTVGWDGCYYPWAFNILDFEPIVGRVHQPPPVHQTFESDGYVLCSFVPRLYDFHPEAIPAPYNHSNVMTDEVLYYCNDEFMSRRDIELGSVTLHPDGLPHGPQPGKAEESIGVEKTDELAVMVDTFAPLKVARQAVGCEDAAYWESWRPDPPEGSR
jgi:homogentisate 1,2-dioxygenase